MTGVTPGQAPEAVPWRQGRSQPRNVYARTGGGDWKADRMIGQLDTPELAAEAVTAHNAAARQPQPAPGVACEWCDHGKSEHIDGRRECRTCKCTSFTPVRNQPEPQPAPELAAYEAAIEQISRMCQRPRETAGTTQGVVVNGERLAGLVLAVIKAAGLEGQ